jgi:hypothetical protein
VQRRYTVYLQGVHGRVVGEDRVREALGADRRQLPTLCYARMQRVHDNQSDAETHMDKVAYP